MNRILLIEDDPSSQLLYRNRLADLGYEVVAASTGAMGLMEARASKYDLFLVDVGLGSGIDGLEVCRRLKGVPELMGIPVVLISGQVKGSQDLHRGYEAGCQAFLKKGDSTLIEDVVRAMLRVKSLQDDLAAQNRLLEEQNRRLQEARERGADLEDALRESESRAVSFRSLATSRPDGLLIVDADGICRMADRGARRLFATSMEGKNLASLLPKSGLEALVRDARNEPHENFRFDLADHTGRMTRPLLASVVPLLPASAAEEDGLRAVLLFDTDSRRMALELSSEATVLGVPTYELGPLREAARVVYNPSALQGSSDAIADLRRRVMDLIDSPDPVWIRGAKGAPKEFVARILHFSGDRDGPFVPVDCAALSPEALEREVRGYVRNAIPDAPGDRPGLLQRTGGGTLFLANADALPDSLRTELIRVIEEGVVHCIGCENPQRVDARLLFSSGPEVELGDIEELGALCLQLPPLHERPEDAVEQASARLQRCAPDVQFAPEVVALLGRHDWPGNEHELETCIESAARQAENEVIEVSDLNPALIELHHHLEDTEAPLPSMRPHSQTAPPPDLLDVEDDGPLLKAFEKRGLLYALHKANGDKLTAAKLAGVGKSTFYRKLKNHGIR